MNKIQSSIHILNKEFENLKVATGKEKIFSSKTQKNILNFQKKIKQIHQQLHQTENHSFNLKDIVKTNDLKEELENLKLNVRFFQAKLPIHFQAQETRSFIKKEVDSFFGLLFNALNFRVRNAIFLEARSKKMRPTLSQKLNQFQNEQTRNQEIFLKLHQNLSQCRSSKELKSIENKIQSVSLKIEKTYFKIKALQKKIHRLETYDVKNNSFREAAMTLGGERVALTTSDHVDLDGLFLDALKFRKNLSKIGCSHVTLTHNNLKINALVLTKENYLNNGSKLLDALKLFHAFPEPNVRVSTPIGAGWQIVHHGDRVYILSQHQLPRNPFKEHSLFKFNSELNQWEIKQNAGPFNLDFPKPMDIENPATSTVIISSGNIGIYEMNKAESMFYLMQNMNVMLFNFRGHGLSQGFPTKTGLKLDMECAYQFVKQRSKHQDKQILFKALCLSSYIASYVASKHPETNIIIDQTYSSFKTLFKETTKKKLKEWISNDSKISKKIINALSSLASLFAPNISTSKYFSKNRGKKAIFYSMEDDFVGIEHVKENIKAVFKTKQAHQLFVASIPGDHGSSIVKAKGTPKNFFPKEAKKLFKKSEDLSKNSMLLRNQFHQEIDLIKKEDLRKKLEKIEIQNGLSLDAYQNFNMANSLFYSQNQLSFFLKKAELSDPIIKN